MLTFVVSALLLQAAAPDTPARAASLPATQRKVVPGAAKRSPGTSFYQLLDEIIDELVKDLAKLPIDDVSPMAIGAVHVSPNISTELEETLAVRLTAQLAAVPGLKQVHCASC